MSQEVLKAHLAEVARLQAEVESSKRAVNVSEACKSIIEFCKSNRDAFDPTVTLDTKNVWKKKKKRDCEQS